ncbi:hypothetical protein DFH08DRAFT_824969 [Mycena albidolilacea]|uniref:Uncharacterized protein n=1 Tax=Mycena albidolilacea TaxID=1033008 RepID=A0AAD6Z3R1_9AGAR|nr:hypothetical protein DFH08DRAFT_824969 [Mycena albidolilacea]
MEVWLICRVWNSIVLLPTSFPHVRNVPFFRFVFISAMGEFDQTIGFALMGVTGLIMSQFFTYWTAIFASVWVVYKLPRFNLRQSMEPTVQAHQSRFKLISPEFSAEIINLIGAADPCARPLLLCFDTIAPQRVHRASGRLYGGSDSLTLSRDHGDYRPAFGTEPGPSSDNLSHALYVEPLNYLPQLTALEQQFDFFM